MHIASNYVCMCPNILLSLLVPESGEGLHHVTWPRTCIWAAALNNLPQQLENQNLSFTAFQRIPPNCTCTKVLPVRDVIAELLMSKRRWNPLWDKLVCAVLGVSVITGDVKKYSLLNNIPPPIMPERGRNMRHDTVVTFLFLLFLVLLLIPPLCSASVLSSACFCAANYLQQFSTRHVSHACSSVCSHLNLHYFLSVGNLIWSTL